MVARSMKPRNGSTPTLAVAPVREVRHLVKLGPSLAAPHNRKPILHVYVGKSTTPLRGTPEAIELRGIRDGDGRSVCLSVGIDGAELLLSVTVADAIILAMQIRKCVDELTAVDNA
jgi:hypothetical protein